MIYTARLNKKVTLPSGNWFTGFSVNTKTRTIVYTYHDRRRNGQVARHYTVTFKADLYTIEQITAVSAHGGRIEHFSTVSIRDYLAVLLVRAKRIKAEHKKFNINAFLYGLFVVLVLIEVITCISLFILTEGTGLFELISNVFLTSALGAIIVGLFAMYKRNC